MYARSCRSLWWNDQQQCARETRIRYAANQKIVTLVTIGPGHGHGHIRMFLSKCPNMCKLCVLCTRFRRDLQDVNPWHRCGHATCRGRLRRSTTCAPAALPGSWTEVCQSSTKSILGTLSTAHKADTRSSCPLCCAMCLVQAILHIPSPNMACRCCFKLVKYVHALHCISKWWPKAFASSRKGCYGKPDYQYACSCKKLDTLWVCAFLLETRPGTVISVTTVDLYPGKLTATHSLMNAYRHWNVGLVFRVQELATVDMSWAENMQVW